MPWRKSAFSETDETNEKFRTNTRVQCYANGKRVRLEKEFKDLRSLFRRLNVLVQCFPTLMLLGAENCPCVWGFPCLFLVVEQHSRPLRTGLQWHHFSNENPRCHLRSPGGNYTTQDHCSNAKPLKLGLLDVLFILRKYLLFLQ